MGGPAVQEITKEKLVLTGAGHIYLDDKSGYWKAEWYDGVGRLVRRQLGQAGEYRNARECVERACQLAIEYEDRHNAQLALKAQTSQEDLEDLAQRSTFPRAVVEREIRRICEGLKRSAIPDDPRQPIGLPGANMFSTRTGILAREVNRILNDDTKIGVGISIVDKICVEFHMIFQDFIDSSFEWADKKGSWEDRWGDWLDPWPIGYRSDPKPDPNDWLS